jgi:hypothetical protein
VCCGNHGWPHAIVIEGIARTFGGSSLSQAQGKGQFEKADQVDFFCLFLVICHLNPKATKSTFNAAKKDFKTACT